MANVYRVLMESVVDRKVFNFAIFCKEIVDVTFFTMQDYAKDDKEAHIWAVGSRAVYEFPDSKVVKVEMVTKPVKKFSTK